MPTHVIKCFPLALVPFTFFNLLLKFQLLIMFKEGNVKSPSLLKFFKMNGVTI